MEDGAFDLDVAKAAAVIGGDVVGGAVSPGLGHAEAEFGGAGHETELRPLTALLGVMDMHPGILHWIPSKICSLQAHQRRNLKVPRLRFSSPYAKQNPRSG